MTFFSLFVAGIIAYIVSTLAGGGGALLLLPIVGFYLSPSVVAPVVNLGNMIGRPMRLYLFWKDIEWRVVKYYLPSSITAAIIGSYFFSKMNASWLQLLLGLFLISTVFQYRFGKKKYSFKMKYRYFIPLGFFVSFISTLFGATGAILNVFYLNMGLSKERLIATKSANSFFTGIVQLSSYSFFGVLEGDLWWYGIYIGSGAIVGNFFGKKLLNKVSDHTFRKMVIGLMFLSGLLMVGRLLF